MIHIHDLEGCAPAPMAHYLKALGILRLVAEQADAGARGWWEGDRFRLATSLSSEALIAYFRDAYVPTPLVAPWNGGTGFYPGDKKAQRAITGIRKHPSPRFGTWWMTNRVLDSLSSASEAHEMALRWAQASPATPGSCGEIIPTRWRARPSVSRSGT